MALFATEVGVNSSFVALTTLVPRVLHFSAIHYLGRWSLLYSFFVPLVMKLICPNDRMNMTETKNWEQETKLRLELALSIHRLLPCRKTKTSDKCMV